MAEAEQKEPDLCARIDRTGQLSDEDRKEIQHFSKAFLTEYQESHKEQ